MGAYVATEVVKCMIKKDIKVTSSRVLMLGITFKENCPDIRNSRAIDIVNELKTYDLGVDVFDPWANPEEVKHEYGIDLLTNQEEVYRQKYEAVVLAVSHNKFLNLDFNALRHNNSVVYDVKSILPKEKVDGRL